MILKTTIPLVQPDEVAKYLPQQAPFIMVDTLWGVSLTGAISGFTVSLNNILVDDGYFQESGIVENIAQTIALKAGYEAAKRQQKPQVGFIVMVKNVVIFDLPSVGEELKTTIEITMNFQDMLVIIGNSFVGDKAIASCEMRVFLEK